MADNLTPEQRSFAMSRMRSTDTRPELAIRKLVTARGLRYRKHPRSVPGRPDLAFPRVKVAVFIDGDFFHGWRFPAWRHALSPYWQAKIERNRQRDTCNFRRLRRSGWRVLRIWQHEIKADARGCADRIERAVRERLKERGASATGPRRSGG